MLKETGSVLLPNGCMLYWKPNGVGGRIYESDEIGGGVFVWDTCLVNESTFLTAMVIEATFDRQKPLGNEEGDTCNRDGCNGIIELEPLNNCTCHLSPPCYACETRSMYCPDCGWNAGE